MLQYILGVLFQKKSDRCLKKIVIYYLALISFVMLSLCAILLVSDPLRLFHTPFFYKNMLFNNMRQQAAGIINTFEYDSIILGTSMLENTSAAEASQALSGRFINVSISGGDFYERFLILNHALRKQKIQNVVYSLDTYYLSPRFGDSRYSLDNWAFLYDSIAINDLQIYFSKFFFDKALFFKKIGRETNFDRPQAWMNSSANAARFGGLNNWLQAPQHSSTKQLISLVKVLASSSIVQNGTVPDDAWGTTQIYIDKYIIAPVASNPDTNFFFVFPPYHTLQNCKLMLHPFHYALHMRAISYITKSLSSYDNAEVYGFSDLSFTDDIANYKDIRHYSAEINSFILQCMMNKKGMLTYDNVDDYIERVMCRTKNFPIAKLQKQIEEYYSKNGTGSGRNQGDI